MPSKAIVKQFFFAPSKSSLTGLSYKGKSLTLPADIESALVMNAGSIKERIRKDQQRPEANRFFIEGRDFETFEGDALGELKAVLRSSARPVHQQAKHLLVLYRTGVDMLCLRSDMPLAVRLCRFLVDEVFPVLRGAGREWTSVTVSDLKEMSKDELAAYTAKAKVLEHQTLLALPESTLARLFKLMHLEQLASMAKSVLEMMPEEKQIHREDMNREFMCSEDKLLQAKAACAKEERGLLKERRRQANISHVLSVEDANALKPKARTALELSYKATIADRDRTHKRAMMHEKRLWATDLHKFTAQSGLDVEDMRSMHMLVVKASCQALGGDKFLKPGARLPEHATMNQHRATDVSLSLVSWLLDEDLDPESWTGVIEGVSCYSVLKHLHPRAGFFDQILRELRPLLELPELRHVRATKAGRQHALHWDCVKYGELLAEASAND